MVAIDEFRPDFICDPTDGSSTIPRQKTGNRDANESDDAWQSRQEDRLARIMESVVDSYSAQMALGGRTGRSFKSKRSTKRNRSVRNKPNQSRAMKWFYVIMWGAAVITAMRYGATIAVVLRDAGHI